MGASPVLFDMSKAQPIAQDGKPLFDMSKATKIEAPAGVEASADDRNAVQKLFDRATTVTPKDLEGHSWLTNQAQKFGAGAINGVGGVFVHPLDTLSGLGHAIAHPIDTATSLVHSAMQEPAQTAGNILGGALMGEGAAGAAKAVSGAVAPTLGRVALLGKTPEAAYEAALKPSTMLSQADRAAAVDTGLKSAIPVSKGGLEKIGDLIDSLNQKIKGTIDSDPNRPIDPNKVATRADLAKARFSNQVNAQPDLNAIDASKQQFLNEQGAQPGMPATPPQPTGVLGPNGQPMMTAGAPSVPPKPAPMMGAADAQAMKQGTYRVLKGKFGEQGSASVEAQKSLARGLKEELANAFPEIGKMNADESRLLDLQPILERAVNRISNHDAVGIGAPIAGTALKAATGSTGLAGAGMVMKQIVDNPYIKSRLAIAVSKGAKIPYAQALARVGAYSTQLGYTQTAPAPSSDGTDSQTSSQP